MFVWTQTIEEGKLMALDLEFETYDCFLSLSVLNVAKQCWTKIVSFLFRLTIRLFVIGGSKVQVTAPSINHQTTQIPLDLIEHWFC